MRPLYAWHAQKHGKPVAALLQPALHTDLLTLRWSFQNIAPFICNADCMQSLGNRAHGNTEPEGRVTAGC